MKAINNFVLGWNDLSIIFYCMFWMKYPNIGDFVEYWISILSKLSKPIFLVGGPKNK